MAVVSNPPVPPGRIWHVLPLNDAAPHEESTDCPCKPKVERVPNRVGEIGLVIVHNSFDGRELIERAVSEATADRRWP